MPKQNPLWHKKAKITGMINNLFFLKNINTTKENTLIKFYTL